MNNTVRYLLLIAISVSYLGCQKAGETAMSMEQSVFFSINQADPSLFKSEAVECPYDENGNLKMPAVAEIIIDGITYHPGVFILNGKLYTQSIKLSLPVGEEVTFNVSRFALLESINGDVVMATPHKDSYFAAYVSQGVDFEISISAFGKIEVSVEVLCYVPETAALFNSGSHQLQTFDIETSIPI